MSQILKFEERSSTPGKLRGPFLENQRYFSKRVDYNLKNINKSGFKYFLELFEFLNKTILINGGSDKYMTDGFYARAENEVSKCSSRELIEIIYLIDRNFEEKPYLKVSKDIAYYTFVRSFAFKNIPKLKIAS